MVPFINLPPTSSPTSSPFTHPVAEAGRVLTSMIVPCTGRKRNGGVHGRFSDLSGLGGPPTVGALRPHPGNRPRRVLRVRYVVMCQDGRHCLPIWPHRLRRRAMRRRARRAPDLWETGVQVGRRGQHLQVFARASLRFRAPARRAPWPPALSGSVGARRPLDVQPRAVAPRRADLSLVASF